MSHRKIALRFELPSEIVEVIVAAAVEMAKHSTMAFRFERQRARGGATLRPGKDTPLWNGLRMQLRPELRKYGQQVNLGQMLGLPRQRINSFVTAGKQMPDAERTLQLPA